VCATSSAQRQPASRAVQCVDIWAVACASKYYAWVSAQSPQLSKPLTAEEEAAWRPFVRALIVAPRVLDADLLEASRLNMAEYHVMVLLSEHADRAMRRVSSLERRLRPRVGSPASWNVFLVAGSLNAIAQRFKWRD
jgi:hypothetical protein